MLKGLGSHVRANVVGYVALFVALTGSAYAATGGNFILGQPNSASSRSTLSAPIADRALQLTNRNTAPGATALGLNVANGHPPLAVNSSQKVPNLNADKLDGVDSSALQRVGLVHWGAAEATSTFRETIIRWNELGAAFTTDGDSDGHPTLRIVNSSSHEITILYSNAYTLLSPGQETGQINVASMLTFIVFPADGARSWLVTCGWDLAGGLAPPRIRCQGVASRVG